MPTLKNSIIIEAPIDRIWEALSQVDKLASYDPTCKSSTPLTENIIGIGAKRRVDMLDNKNWFEEKCTIFEKHKDLKYELTACSFPVHKLSHRYNFQQIGDGKFEVSQIQEFTMKYGILGKVMALIIKPKWNKGVKIFLKGLKKHSEGVSVPYAET